MGSEAGHPIRTLAILAAMLAAGVGAALYAALGDDPDAVLTTGDAPPAAAVETAVTTSAAKPGATAKAAATVPDAAHVHGVVRLYRTKAAVEGLALALKPAQGTDLTATTGADGAFRFDSVPPGKNWELRGVREPYVPIALPMDLAPTEDRDLDTLWLDVPVELRAIVIDLSGKPLKGAQVEAFATPATETSNDMWWDQRSWEQRVLALTTDPKPVRAAATDADGAARIGGLMPGTYRVRASAAGFAAATRSGVLLAPDAASSVVRFVLGIGHRLDGAVTDEKNAPVAGANVIAVGGAVWNVGIDKWTAKTSDKGLYAFDVLPAGRVSFYLERKGKPLLVVGSAGIPETTRYDIHLRPAATIRGTVTDDEGKPVGGAEIHASMQNSWSPMAATSDKDGKFALIDVPAGPIAYFRVECKGFMPFPDPSAPAAGSGESLREGTTMVRDVVLRRGLSAEIHVLAADTNAPIERCEIAVHVVNQRQDTSRPWRATTDKEGVAKLAGLVPGNYLVVLKAPGYVQEGLAPWIGNLLGSPDATPSQWRLAVGLAPGDAKAEYKLTRGAVVTGRVWDRNKQPVVGARVSVQGARNEFPVFSDAEGKFKVEAVAPSNRCTVDAFGADGAYGRSEPFIVRPAQAVENIDVKLAASGRVVGSVRAADGRPLVGAMVRFVRGRLDENNPWGFQQFQSAERFAVGPDGRFEIPSLPEGNVTVRADAEGALPAWKNDVIVIPGQETAGLELLLRAAVEISGRVEAQSGGPVPSAQVSAQFAGGERRGSNGFVTGLSGEPSAQTDAEGKFTLKGLQEGSYLIYAQAPGYAAGTRVTTKTGAGDVLIRLATGKFIRGVVKDESQAPVGGVPVRATKTENAQNDMWWWWGNAQVYTAPDGTFELADLADGAYDLTVSAMWQWGRDVNVEDTKLQGVNAGRDDVSITVKTGSVIEGSVVDRDGKPIRVAWITAAFESGNQQNNDWSSQRWAQTKSDGTFRVVGLKPGGYTIWAYGDFKASSAKGVGSGTKDAKIQVEPAFWIAGRLADIDGLSIAGQANFQVKKSGTEQWQWMNVIQPGDGSFIVLGLDQGRYDLQIQAWGYAPMVVPNVTSGERELVVTVQKGIEMSGSVVNSRGDPVANANVQAQQLTATPGVQPSQGGAQSDAQGNFKLTGLAAGEYRLIVRGANLAPALIPSVTAGSTNVKVVLEVGVTISGTITDEAGAALSGVQIQMQLMTEQNVSLAWMNNMKSDGTFTFNNVPSNMRWKLMGWGWSQGGQYTLSHEGLVDSGATDVKVVAKKQ